MFPGLDVSEWDPHMVWLWQWSNLRLIGFYLAHGAGQTLTRWTPHRHDFFDLGWGIVPFWLPFSDDNIDAMKTSNGTAHGQEAVARARDARVERGATLYLDVENQIDLTTKNSPFLPYLVGWMAAVRAAGYAPGVYCTRLNAGQFLNRSEFQPFHPVVWPVSVHATTRADWDDDHYQLGPVTPDKWPVNDSPPDPDGGEWAASDSAVGCQYDWFNDQRDRKIFHWPDANGHHDGSRDVDWDVSRVFDPAHPQAAGAFAMAPDQALPDYAYVLGTRTTGLEYFERTTSGRFATGQSLTLRPGDLGPQPTPQVDGFDSVWVAGASRRHGHVDFFLLGQDKFIRTAWINDREKFPVHPWPLNPQNPARKGSPIVAVSRALDLLDVFYVDQDHHLVTQWWNPRATQWPLNRRVLPQQAQPAGENNLVSGGSNLAALPSPQDGMRVEDRLDVFYVSLNYAVPYGGDQASAKWNNAWNVVHARWSSGSDWQVSRIPDLTRVAAGSGIAAVRDGAGAIHLMVQSRDRSSLSHAVLGPAADATWSIRSGPGPIPLDAARRPCWWMSLSLCSIGNRLILFGMSNTQSLCWALFENDRWSSVVTATVNFAPTRPLAFAKRGAFAIDLVGIAEDGHLMGHSLNIGQGGAVNLGVANGLPT